MGYGAVDMGVKLAVFRYLTEGINEDVGFSVQFWRKPLPIFSGALATFSFRVPFEIGHKAYMSDQKFPTELRRGYRSPYHAMFKLFMRDPIMLFRNGYPSMWASFYETFIGFYLYDELKDFSWYFINEANYNQNVLRVLNGWFSASTALFVAFYHDVAMRKLVESRQDKTSKELFQGNYRRAHGFLQQSNSLSSMYNGFGNYYIRNFWRLFLTFQVADRMGLFTKWRIIPDRQPYTTSEETFHLYLT